VYDINVGQIADSIGIFNRIDKSQRRRPLCQHAPQRQPPGHGEAIEDEDGPAVVVLWAGVVCEVPVGDDDACRDGGEDAEAEGTVAAENDDGGDDVKDQDEDGDDNLGEAEGEGVGGEGDNLFVQHDGMVMVRTSTQQVKVYSVDFLQANGGRQVGYSLT
jgi:hypothetical protein